MFMPWFGYNMGGWQLAISEFKNGAFYLLYLIPIGSALIILAATSDKLSFLSRSIPIANVVIGAIPCVATLAVFLEVGEGNGALFAFRASFGAYLACLCGVALVVIGGLNLVGKTLGDDFVRTVLRWREVDYRLLFGGFVVLCLLVMRLSAIGLDVTDINTDGKVFEPRAALSGFMVSGANFSPNCRAAPGYLLGTEHNGRSLAKALVDATESFFGPAVLCCAIALFLGTLLGAVAGYFRGGVLEASIKLVLTVVASYPRLILVIVAIGIFTAEAYAGGGSEKELALRLQMMAGLLGLAYVPILAMAVYQKVGSFQREQFVEAARAHGLSDTRILGFHILWANCTPVLARHFFYLFGYFILVETSLSFLGPNYGVPASIPSWGNLLAGCKTGSSLLSAQILAPSCCILLSILGLTLLGDAIGDHFERGRH